MQETHEQWRIIPGYDGKYEVSDFGNVRAYGVLRKLSVRRPSGHLRVGLNGATCDVHRLVMEVFVGPVPTGCEILHIDHNPSNNRVTNLKYGTRSENIKMDFAAGTRNHKGANAPNARLSASAVEEIRASSASSKELAAKYCVHVRTVRHVRANETWTKSETTPTRSLVGKCLLKERIMAKAKKTLTAAEIKARKTELTKALKDGQAALKPFTAAVAEASKALAAAKKEADKAIAAAQKAYDAASAKAAKASAAAEKGAEKIQAQIAELDASAE